MCYNLYVTEKRKMLPPDTKLEALKNLADPRKFETIQPLDMSPCMLDNAGNREIFLTAVRDGLSFSSAGDLIGINGQDLANYRRRDPEFHASVVKAAAEYEYGLLRRVNIGAEDDPRLALEVLSRRFPHKWSPRVEVRTDLREQATGNDIHNADDELLLRIARAIPASKSRVVDVTAPEEEKK